MDCSTGVNELLVCKTIKLIKELKTTKVELQKPMFNECPPGVITGFEKAVDVGAPIVKDLTQEARNYVNSPEQLRTTQ